MLTWKGWKKAGDAHLINRIRWDKAEVDILTSVLESDWFAYSKFNSSFESKISEFTKVPHVHLTNSGSAAIMTAIKALIHAGQVKRGDLVLHPVTTFATSISSAIDFGLVPVFLETEPGTYVVDAAQVELAIKKYPEVRGLILPHLLGNAAEMDRIVAALGKNRFLIEDCCDTLGCYYDGKHVGSFADFMCLSFYGSHHITSGGIGGAVGTTNPEYSELVRSMIFWGRDFSLGENFLNRYKYKTLGMDSQMTSLQAAFGLAQMDRLPGFVKDRATQFSEMTAIFENSDYFVLPRVHKKADPSWFGFPVLLQPDAPFSRQDFVDYLTAMNVEIRPIMCGNILRQKVFASSPHIAFARPFPIGEAIEERGFFIPCWGMPQDQRLAYYDIIEEFLEAAKAEKAPQLAKVAMG